MGICHGLPVAGLIARLNGIRIGDGSRAPVSAHLRMGLAKIWAVENQHISLGRR